MQADPMAAAFGRGSAVPIADYGLLGDTRTAALVAADGSMDWLCLPRFDSDPVFGRLIGGDAAGTFRIGPRDGDAPVVRRRYLPETATLETTWATSSGLLTLTEGMVAEVSGQLLPSTLLVRRLSASGGPVEAVVEFDPRFGERQRSPRTAQRGDTLVCTSGPTAMALTVSPFVAIEVGGSTRVTVEPDRPLVVALAAADREPLVVVDADFAWGTLQADGRGWQEWCTGVAADIPHRDAVIRSLLTLRLLTYSPSGAPVAAPTTSLPEHLGGSRNWDYRYAWPRDASIGVAAFLGVGKEQEARHFLAWLLHASRLDRPRLPVLLTLHGCRAPRERELAGWSGYADSRPVRVGNGAADQHQLDGYGWVLDAAWLFVTAGHRLYSETWRALRAFADQVSRRWREPDAGIWEERGEPTHHVHSKLMAWLALDRALGIAATHRTPARQVRRWETERDALAIDINDHGFNSQLNSYTRSYDSIELDAAVLVLPLLQFEPTDSTRTRGTLAAIRHGLEAGGPLLYRYTPGSDGLPGGEGIFLPCSFWCAQALAATGDLDSAEELLDELVGLATPLGLYAEELDPISHAHLGNFPQALTHAALIQAALAIRDARPHPKVVPGCDQ